LRPKCAQTAIQKTTFYKICRWRGAVEGKSADPAEKFQKMATMDLCPIDGGGLWGQRPGFVFPFEVIESELKQWTYFLYGHGR
jgi:hypothetical protein